MSQVRKPIYKTSVERGRRYGDKLNPLIEALGLPVEETAKAEGERKAEAKPKKSAGRRRETD